MLVVNRIRKTIKSKVILNDISLTLNAGTIYGFVGRNGSGKTMLFRAISGLMKVDAGDISYQGKKLHQDFLVLPNLGITIENAGLYPEFTGLKNLQLLAKLNRKIDTEQIKKSIKRVGLEPNDSRSFRKYSLGMKQRIAIAQAIMEQPDLILLDEPTNSLDEEGVRLIRQVIREEKQRGAMILLASHNKEDIQLLADKVFYLDAGRLVDEVYPHAE
ncbi:ABC-2 type transport system ATP-binding protein [Natronobacillus azotifigens]|uniref:ABC transporter ATP-binding protein n=1 Tax=Natronobacillus azotifigens TaxID=472978 RepID=A0A9J6RFJ3_9BACI|nr:ABC transporter ATP-binding protein [Natronobacillus azotifigens]